MRKYKAVIFDLDGVICYTDEYHYLAWKELAGSLGVYFDCTINNRLRGVSRMESLDIILERYNGAPLTQEDKHKLAEQKNVIYRHHLGRMSPADLPANVRRTLYTLRQQGMKLAIGSSSKNAPLILDHIGLGDFFDAVADGNCITRSKPDPEVFLKAADMLHEDPADCLVVEDAISGAQAGHAGGFTVACVGDAARSAAGEYNFTALEEVLSIL